MDLVIVGHVDHGKSTVIGRLLADTGSLPEGKLEAVKAHCARTARPFEYAFLLDALKAEQAQGITIDTARCFFKTAKRDYIVNDAPGHIEFLKNMVTGAARAEAALLVIDAKEGVRENSKRHGYIMSMLGVRQLAVLVNKMDLVLWREEVFEAIRAEYVAFLARLGVSPASVIPVSAQAGANLVARGVDVMPWYSGPTVLEQIESFEPPTGRAQGPFRMPVQDVYKFTEEGDDRRIVAGTIESGELRAGDEVVFLPSRKRSRVSTIEAFGRAEATRRGSAAAGSAAGFTMETQVYVRPGELACKTNESCARTGTRFRVTLFWMGRDPMVVGKAYKLKLGATRARADLVRVESVLDASELTTVEGKQQVDRHDVAECIVEAARPVAFDLRNEVEATGRFVVVDNFEIAGCGIILEALEGGQSLLRDQVRGREARWERGLVGPNAREERFHHKGKAIVVVGDGAIRRDVARQLERRLFDAGRNVYYLGVANVAAEIEGGNAPETLLHDEKIRHVGELARVLTGAGLLFITTIGGADDDDLETLRVLNEPNDLFVVAVGETRLSRTRPNVAVPDAVAAGEATAIVERALAESEVLLDWVI